MAILLPQDSLVLNAYAVLAGQTPGYAAFNDHKAYIATNGEAAYKSALNSVFATYSNAQLGASMLANLGLGSIFTQADAEAYLAANATNRVGAMLDLAKALYSYAGPDASVLAAKAAYVNTVDGSYNYSINSSNVTPTALTSSGSGAQTVTLTTGLDNLTANQFFSSETYYNVDGKGPTLNAGDVLTGQAGRTDNTLTVTDLTPGVANGNIPAGVKLTNIQNIILNSSNNTAGGTGFSTVGYADVRSLTGITNGGGADLFSAKNGVDGTTVNVTHNGYAGATTIVGGTDVTATTVGGNIIVGNSAAGRVPLATEVATGAIVVNQNFSGAGAVNVFGGTTVTVNTTSTSNTGAINIGNTAVNTGNTSAGAIANASGNITVNTAGRGAVTAFGGNDVTVNSTALGGAAGAVGAITVGDVAYRVASNLPKGNVVITETNQIAYNGLAGSANNNQVNGTINVYGGKDVSITTNGANAINVGNLGAANETALNPTGKITITNTGIESAAAAGAMNITGGTDVTVTTTGSNVTIGRQAATAGAVLTETSNPTGNVTVTETMNGAGFARAVTIDGGKDVTVNAKGQTVTIGTAAKSAPTGAVVVKQADIFTGNTNAVLNGTNAGDVTVDGGTTVTVTTTGGNVTVGGVVAGVNTVPSGAVNITRTFSGPGADTTAVQGGTTVAITTTKTSGAITVGANSVALSVDGTALKDAKLAPTGDVTIVNKTGTAYGTSVTNVSTNGATTVSVTGGDVDNIVDIQSTLATGGSNAGKAVGTSKLATVVIDGLQNNNNVAIQSDALTALTVTNNKGGANTVTITNNTAAHDLTVTQGGNATGNAVTVADAKAGKVTVTDNGTASTATLTLNIAKATEVTINNAAAASLTLGGVNTDAAKVTLKGAGNTTFVGETFGTGNLSKAMVVDATAATGNVTAAIQLTTTADTTQQYLGGAGVDTLTINSNASGWGNLAKIDGGNGSADVLVANYAAAGTDVALGNAAAVKGFEILKLGTAATSAGGNYDAAGFSEVQVGAVTAGVAVTNAASGVTLNVQDNTTGADTISLTGANTTATNNALTVSLGTAGATAATSKAINDGTTTTGAITANGYEALTVNAVGQIVTAGAATIGDTVTINGVASNGAATLTVGGAASLALTSNTGFTSINASGNTGATVDVSAASVSNNATTFTGGAAKLVATGSNATANQLSLVTIGGTGASPIANGETVTVTLTDATGGNAGTYTYTNGTGGAVTAATAATSITAAINAAATTGSTVLSASAGTKNVGVTATASGGNIVLSSASVYEVATATNAVAGTIADSILGGQQQFVITADAVGGGAGNGGVVGITFAGGTASISTAAIADGATAAAVATAIATAITGTAAANKPGIASAVVFDTNKVLVTMQQGQISSMALNVGGAAGGSTDAITFAGAGLVESDAINNATVNNAFVTGAGGGTYKVGLGGSWNAVNHKFSSGSETVTLDASTAKADTLVLKEGAVATDNGTKGGVTKFVVDSQSASDVITFRNAADNGAQAKTILTNAVTGVVNTVNGAATMANVLDSSGALNTKLANLTYTISNGVITFSATGGHSLSEFTNGELVSAAQILVASSTTGGANKVAAFSANGRSFVVSSDNGNTLAAGTDNKSAIVELKDVASVKGFGSTFGEGTIVSDTVTNLTGSAANNGGTAIDLAALATSSTLDYTGFALATLNVAGTAAANTNTTKFTKLAASAELDLNATGNTHLGLLETTQVGTAGHNSLTVNTLAASVADRLTVNGDALVKFINNGVAATVTELVDATNTMNTVQVGAGAGATTLTKITSTALTTVDTLSAGATVTLGNGTFTTTTNYTVTDAVAQNNLTFKLATGQAATIFASGSGDTFTQGSATTSGTGAVSLVASGASNSITLSNGANGIVANGAGDTITVGTGSNTIVATGAGDTFNIASGAGTTAVTVGSNATLNIGTVNTANTGAETVFLVGAVTGGTVDSYAKTTINFASGSTIAGNKIDFSGTADAFTLLGGSVKASQVNVASATTLNDALNLAANYTLLTTAQGTDPAATTLAANTAKVDWFQFGGDTYVVAAVNSTAAAVQQTGLDANDVVVKITGLVDLTGSNFAGEALTI